MMNENNTYTTMVTLNDMKPKYSLKSHKLTSHHIKPEHYEKMSVGLAYQVREKISQQLFMTVRKSDTHAL